MGSYIRVPNSKCVQGEVWGTIGFLLTPRVRKWVAHPGFLDLISVGGSDRYLEDLSPDITRD